MKDTFLEFMKLLEKNMELCPWIKEQDIHSFKKQPLGEAKELIEAIEKKDFENIKEEIGDLLYDVLLMAMIAERDNITTRKEILENVMSKMRRRKPYIFGDAEMVDKDGAEKMWYKIKEKEKKENL